MQVEIHQIHLCCLFFGNTTIYVNAVYIIYALLLGFMWLLMRRNFALQVRWTQDMPMSLDVSIFYCSIQLTLKISPRFENVEGFNLFLFNIDISAYETGILDTQSRRFVINYDNFVIIHRLTEYKIGT